MDLRPALSFAQDWGNCVLDVAFPWPESQEEAPVRIEAPLCRQCGLPFPALEDLTGDFVCGHCQQKEWSFLWARAGYLTAGQVHEAVVGFKYEEEFYRRAQLVNWLVETYDRFAAAEQWDGLVPVPLHHRRYRDRGFNQARELADGLGGARNVPVIDCLYRYRETDSQTGLRRNERWNNMKHAFLLKPKFDLRGKNLLIIDDVFTTGATVNACARVLAEAGASRLAVLTIARS